MKNRRFSYFKRLFLFCILIGFIPVITLGYFSYSKSSQLLLDKAHRSDMEMVEQTQLRFEQKLKMVDNAQAQITNSPLLIDAMEQALDKDDYLAYEKLMQTLYRQQLYEFGLSDVYLVNFNKNWILSSAGKESLQESKLGSTFTEYANKGKLFFWTALKSPFFEKPNLRVWNTAIVKTIPINSFSPLGLLIAVLPSQELNKMIPKGSGSESGDMYVLDEHHQIIAGRNPEWIGKDLSNEAYMETIKLANREADQFETDNHTYEITYRQSNYNGWIYVAKTNINEITKESKAIGWVTIFICLLVCILIFIVSFEGTRRLYGPVRKLYDLVLKSPDMPRFSKRNDEFYWIEKNMHVLMGKESRYRQQLRDFFVHKLLQGAVSAKEIADRIESNELESWKRMRVICVRIDTLEGTNYTDRDRDLLLFAILNIAGELIPEQLRLNPVVINDLQVTLLGDYSELPEASKAEIYEWAAAIQNSVEQYLHLNISMGISCLFMEMSEAPKAFKEAKEALSYSVRLGQQSILFLEDMKPEGTDPSVTYPQQVVNELMDHIKLMDEAGSYRLLDEFMAIITRKAISQQEFQLVLLRLLVDITRLVQEMGGTLYDMGLQDKEMVNEILALKSTKEIVGWLQHTMIRPLMNYIDKSRETLYTRISDQMLAIIDQEYDSPLSLESCAARLNYHPEYISRVFRKETGFVFSDYLSRHRLQMAKKFLIETNMTITEISEKMRYNNPQNFIRYFRKLEGITPKQYRELSLMRK
ncbi:Response regulator containing CheY-like receiver domain and AraC-type DNA-binding domain [Paenibacillus sp. 1_12]|uniref:helix-turn-helix domain-containing protein n=1 Tax=Paenibacillus sp. 1_12 TaxID=1566278 RepID=UPI0008F44CC0|nr:helix-turn-helix domain-containing protein [Paenibacillus sp. 1_12]SFL57321.1 Response regulator containing CheY-like receiver domain and AraC-type DNA-binding domain [Paenibacillus sp. 1_12]